MTWKASSSPRRKSASSWSSERTLRSGTEARCSPAGAWTLAASKGAPADCNRCRGRKFRDLVSGAQQRAPPNSSLRQRRHHVLDVHVVLDGVHGEVLAVAGLAVAAVGHLGGDR